MENRLKKGGAKASKTVQNRDKSGTEPDRKTPRRRSQAHLKPETWRWWQDVVDEWDLDEHHIRLLTLAAEAWDRCVEAREILAREGLTYLDRFDQPKPRPEVGIERDSRLAFARLLRELDLDAEPPKESSSRPPGIQGE